MISTFPGYKQIYDPFASWQFLFTTDLIFKFEPFRISLPIYQIPLLGTDFYMNVSFAPLFDIHHFVDDNSAYL